MCCLIIGIYKSVPLRKAAVLFMPISPFPWRYAVNPFERSGKMELVFIACGVADIRNGKGSQL